jgi:hypothetical protein
MFFPWRNYSFFFSSGIERNIKVWTIDRHWLITRQRARLITFLIILIVIIYNHPFLYWPLQSSYCYFTLFNYSIIYTCSNAQYNIYGYSFSLINLLLIENIGLNNILLPLIIILTNIILIIGLRRRNHQRRYQLGTNKTYKSKERSVILYIIFSSMIFILLTLPIGILGIWGISYEKRIPTNNLSFVFDLMEIVHHCSHFPILFMTSSMIRRKIFQTRLQRQKLISRKPLTKSRFYTQTPNKTQPFHPRLITASWRKHNSLFSIKDFFLVLQYRLIYWINVIDE